MSVDHSLTYKNKSIKNIAHQIRLRMIIEEIKTNTLNRQIETYTDIGCSNGFVTDIVANIVKPYRTVGLDHNKENIIKGMNDYPYIEFEKFDLNVLEPFKEKYDLVTCFETLEHVGNIHNALTNILEACNRNGIIIITVPIEIGLIGFLKYMVKTRIHNYKLDELGVQDKKKYEKDLLLNYDMSKYRCGIKRGYGTHFGFDYRIIDQYLISQKVSYKAKKKLLTRFYIIPM